jgi:hypothetical protein
VERRLRDQGIVGRIEFDSGAFALRWGLTTGRTRSRAASQLAGRSLLASRTLRESRERAASAARAGNAQLAGEPRERVIRRDQGAGMVTLR